MSNSSDCFENDGALNNFAQGLRPLFPARCSDTAGNTCGEIIYACHEIATDIDCGEMDKSEAIMYAEQEGARIESVCDLTGFSLARTHACGQTILHCVSDPTLPS